MSGAIPPLPQYVFMAWCLVKNRDNFTFFTILVHVEGLQFRSMCEQFYRISAYVFRILREYGLVSRP
jgi:hypothetical protein